MHLHRAHDSVAASRTEIRNCFRKSQIVTASTAVHTTFTGHMRDFCGCGGVLVDIWRRCIKPLLVTRRKNVCRTASSVPCTNAENNLPVRLLLISKDYGNLFPIPQGQGPPPTHSERAISLGFALIEKVSPLPPFAGGAYTLFCRCFFFYRSMET